jgi:hypothetical protein
MVPSMTSSLLVWTKRAVPGHAPVPLRGLVSVTPSPSFLSRVAWHVEVDDNSTVKLTKSLRLFKGREKVVREECGGDGDAERGAVVMVVVVMMTTA